MENSWVAWITKVFLSKQINTQSNVLRSWMLCNRKYKIVHKKIGKNKAYDLQPCAAFGKNGLFYQSIWISFTSGLEWQCLQHAERWWGSTFWPYSLPVLPQSCFDWNSNRRDRATRVLVNISFCTFLSKRYFMANIHCKRCKIVEDEMKKIVTESDVKRTVLSTQPVDNTP